MSLQPSDPSVLGDALDESPPLQPGSNPVQLTQPQAGSIPQPAATATSLQIPAGARRFDDPAETRRLIFENVMRAAQSIEPAQNPRFSLQVENPRWSGPEDFTPSQQKEAVLSRGSLARRLLGTLVLRDAAGNTVSSRNMQLARIPWMTDRGTFVVNGTEYSLANQMRLRPGVFTREKSSGDIEAHVNVSKGYGHRVFLEPKTGIFRLQMGQSKLPLLPLLRAMGVQDREIREAWGSDLAADNAKQADPSVIRKLHQKLFRNQDQSPTDDIQRASVAQAFQEMTLDPEVTRRTLGGEYTNVGPQTLLAITKKLLKVSRGEEQPDDRDALAYQTLMGPEDLFAERLKKAKSVSRQLLWKASARGNLDHVSSGPYEDVMRGTILSTGLGQPLEMINAAELLDQQSRVTRMGEGGLVSMDAVPMESRAVQPTQFGFVDFIRTPESLAAGLDSRMARSAVKGADGKIYTQVSTPDGQLQYKTPQDLADSVIAFPGELKSGKSHVAAMVRGRMQMVPREQANYEIPNMEGAFSHLGNMIPMKSAIKGQRASMGMRFLSQALSLVDAEAPWVQSGMPGGGDRSFEEEYGKNMGAVFADQVARVDEITPDGIVLTGKTTGRYQVPLYSNYPFSRKSFLHQTPVVKPGDTVHPGQLLVRSNFTDDKGTTALGKNARVAYTSFQGLNFEDAVTISESFAKRLSSDQMYREQHEWEDKDHRGKNAFLAMFPSAYSRKVLDNFDDDGVVKPGTRVSEGDPLILIAREKERNRKSLLRGNKPSYQDASQTWEHASPGIVTDVVKTDKGASVVVKSVMEMNVGDKLSNRFGGKGVVSAIIPDDKMPTLADGKPAELLLNPLGITSRCYDDKTEFLVDRGWVFGRDVLPSDKFVCYHPWTEGLHLLDQLGEFYTSDYSGPMLRCRNKLVDFCVTPNHRMWANCGYPGAPWQEVTADRIFGRKGWKVPVAGNPVPGVDTDFVLPHITRHVKDTQSSRAEIVIDAGDWAEFLGWYLAEGNSDEKVHISQSATANAENCNRIASLLNRLPFAWNRNDKNKQFHITSKRLCVYLKQFGLCREKWIPAWVFEQTPATRQRFLDAYLAGDGIKDKSNRENAYWAAATTSSRLASDVQRLMVYQGYSSNVAKQADGVWRASLHNMRHRVLSSENWSQVDYVGKIYCPTVPTGYIVTRRNGKILIAGNTNPAQIVEAALGKVAAITGKPIKIPDFENQDDLVEFAIKELEKAGISDTETITDPETGRKIPDVLAGNVWVMKLHHQAESKAAGRGLGSYTAEGVPAKGSSEGSKRVGVLESNALLSHGSPAVIRDVQLFRGQASPQFWSQYMSGFSPATPGVPDTYKKFVASLKGAGINAVRDGHKTHIMAMTDKDIDQLAGDREIRNAETVDWQTMSPVRGGLFDEALTGGHGNNGKWAYIKLHEPLPNPVMEDPIRRVLGLTEKQLHEVISGTRKLGDHTGPRAVAAALQSLNLDRELERAREEFRSGKRSSRDAAVRRLQYLKSAKRLGIHPRDWMLNKVPVLPPSFRPVSVMGAKKLPLVDDANLLYKDLFETNQVLKNLSGRVDESNLGQERLALYRSFQAVTGLGDPIGAKNQERRVKGILQHVLGSSPKYSVVQRRLIGSAVDLVGRSVVVPDPDLDMDSVAIPENQAWTIYRPTLVRRLVRRGMPRLQAVRAVEERSSAARQELVKETEEGVVLVNRAPTLHRFGLMAARPRLTKGNVLKVSPLTVGGFGMDFDGDTVNYHVPVTEDARREALEKMLPSKNLLGASNFKVIHSPGQEYVGGLYEASARQDNLNRPITFATLSDAVRAYRQGRISIDRQVNILNR